MMAALAGHRNAFHIVGHAIGKIDVDKHGGRNPGIEHPPNDPRSETNSRLPERWLSAARIIGLRQSDRWNPENSPFDGTGNRTGIDNIFASIATSVDSG